MNRAMMTVGMLVFAAVCVSGQAGYAQTATDLQCDGCVGTADLATASVTSGKIRNHGVRSVDLAGEAKPAGAAFSESKDYTALGPDAVVLRRVTINAPSKGIIVANAGGNPYFSASGPETIYCTLTQDKKGQVDSTKEIVTAQTGDNDHNKDTPIALARAFPVKKGKQVIYLICEQVGLNSNVFFYHPVLVAFFVPGDYGTTVSEAGVARDNPKAEERQLR